MESKKKLVKKPTNSSTPANQSTLAFPATSTMQANSPFINPPYVPDEQIKTSFQLAFTLLELAQLGDIAVHRGPTDVKQYVAHCHTFTQRDHLVTEAKKKFAVAFNTTRNDAKEIDDLDADEFADLTKQVVGTYTKRM